MTCEDTLLLISARLDGEIGAADRQQLEEHLRHCDACAATAEAFEIQDADLRAGFAEQRLRADTLAGRVAEGLPMATLTPPTSSIAGPRRYQQRLVVAVAAVAAVILVAILVRRDPGLPPLPGAQAVAADLGGGLTARARPQTVPPPRLEVGATLQTAAGERQRRSLPDGSILYVNQNSSLTVTQDRLLNLNRGEVFLDVVPLQEGQTPFEVRTPRRSLWSLGTRFSVRADAQQTALLVAQGHVKASDWEDPIPAGWSLDEKGVTPAGRASAQLDWTRDLMAEAETPLVPASGYSGGALVAVDSSGQQARLGLRKYHVDVHVEDGFARTTIDQTYFNHANWRLEGTFYFPLPPDASLSRLAMYVEGKRMEGGMVERDFGRQVYEKIVHSQRDPALLEWVDGTTFKMRVFPLEARQEKRILLGYTQRLSADYGHVVYRFPAGHSLEQVGNWSFRARVVGGARLAAVSPSHPKMRTTADGEDLILEARERDLVRPRDVIVELHDPSQIATGQPRFSAMEFEDHRYLMVRQQPLLDTMARTQPTRRDWIVLHESSGDRDPLLARAQIEILRQLLAHAELGDTLTFLSVGTYVRVFDQNLLPATKENREAGLAFLEKSHLIGALNLAQALSQVRDMSSGRSHPVVVHVGGGIAAMGERREDVLAQILPAQVPYIGVGVGKRWSRAFMKAAAERSGGYVTQIHPDEPIAWRAFELASALRLPRLLDIKVVDDTGRPWLTFANSANHGEEIGSIVRLPKDTPAPQQVLVTGTVDGQPYRAQWPIRDIREGAGFLPRTWARLEIDRLLAEGSSQHRATIVQLSKASYVMSPFTSLLVLENEAMYAEHKVERGRKEPWAPYASPDTIPVVYEPDPNSPVQSPGTTKPTRAQVLQSILVRVPPRCLTTPGAAQGQQTPVIHALQVLGAAPSQEGFLGRTVNQTRSEFDSSSLGEDFGVEIGLQSIVAGSRRKYSSLDFFMTDGASPLTTSGRFLRGNALPSLYNQRATRFDATSLFSRAIRNDTGRDLYADFNETTFRSYNLSLGDTVAEFAFSPDGRRGTTANINGITLWDRDFDGDAFDSLRIEDYRLERRRKRNRGTVEDLPVHFDSIGWFGTVPIEGRESTRILDRQVRANTTRAATVPISYARPGWTNDRRVFTDLLSYAPGLNTTQADIEAILEAEAMPTLSNLPGQIDPAVRALFTRVRSTGWQRYTLLDDAGKSLLSLVADGAGRFGWERTLPHGLRERVVCDGQTLWHLYPDLGLGARRTLSRFHRNLLARLVPGILPPVEDLAHGHDLTSLDAQRFAISPRGAASARTFEGKPVTYIREEWAFTGDRLAERRVVLMPEGKMLARTLYSEEGVISLQDEDNKEIARRNVRRADSAAPDLAPDTTSLVVLPLPFRSRNHTYSHLDLHVNQSLQEGENRCHEYLSSEEALILLTSEAASQEGGRAHTVYHNCFAQRGDRRLGFLPLLLSCGGLDAPASEVRSLLAQHAQEPLVRYLALATEPRYQQAQELVGLNLGHPGLSGAGFFQTLAAFRDRILAWDRLDPNRVPPARLQAEQDLGIRFVQQYRSSPFAWALLSVMQDKSQDAEVAFHGQLASAWGLFSEHPILGYAAHYERARHLLRGGDRDRARTLYQEMFTQAVRDQRLPALDAAFREALQGEGADADRWSALMRETATAFIRDNQRPAVVALAWQCWQLGDAPLAANLLDEALRRPEASTVRSTILAALQYLSQTGQNAAADALLLPLLESEDLKKHPGLWRFAATLAETRGDTARATVCLENALALEFEHLPDVIDLEKVRADYGKLLDHYLGLARAVQALGTEAPLSLRQRTVRAADSWRALDQENESPCQQAATILRLLGDSSLAWEYLTTPLGKKPNESAPWINLAQALIREGQPLLADRAFATAFEAEPTNAQILWDRAQNLRHIGRFEESKQLLIQLVAGDWQPRFTWVRSQARWQLEGR